MSKDGEKLYMMYCGFCDPDRIRQARWRIFVLITAALWFLSTQSEAIEVKISSGNYPIPVIESSTSTGTYHILDGLNYGATVVKDGTQTVTQRGLAQELTWQTKDSIYLGCKQADGTYIFKTALATNDATPTISGNEIKWLNRWTSGSYSIDYRNRYDSNRILKYVDFPLTASAVLPSPTGAEFFPGASADDLVFAIGANFLNNLPPGCVVKIDGVEIDPDAEQAIGKVLEIYYGGAFLHRFETPYCDAVDSQGEIIFLGDLGIVLNVFSWRQAQAAKEFDPSYSFQTEGLLEDTQIAEDYSTNNYYTGTSLAAFGSGTGTSIRAAIFQISSATLASTYNLLGTTASITSEITSVSLKLTAYPIAGSPTYNVRVKREMKAANLSTVTWNSRSTALHTLYDYSVSSWVAGTTHTFNDASILQWVQKCVVGATDCQFYLEGLNTNGTDLGGYYSLDNATYGYHPVLTMTIEPAPPYPHSLSGAWINNSTIYVVYPTLPTLSTPFAFSFGLVNADSTLISAGTSSAVTGYPDSTHYISQIALPEAVSSLSRIGLYWLNGAASASGVIVLENVSSGGSGSSLTAAAVDQAIAPRIAAVTEFVSAATAELIAEIDENQTLIGEGNVVSSANNVLLHEVDFRTREIQKNTAAGGQVIPSSGVVFYSISNNYDQTVGNDITWTGLSMTDAEPTLSMAVRHGDNDTLFKSYNIGYTNTITYAGEYDMGAGWRIGGASVYAHVYTFDLATTDPVGTYRLNGVVSDGTKIWAIPERAFVLSATAIYYQEDQMTQSHFDDVTDMLSTNLNALIAGNVIETVTNFTTTAVIERSMEGMNIDDGFDYQYVPANELVGFTKSIQLIDENGDTTTTTYHFLYDYDSTNDKRCMMKQLTGYTVLEWAGAKGWSITWPGGSQ